jgi:hypothetical protein
VFVGVGGYDWPGSGIFCWWVGHSKLCSGVYLFYLEPVSGSVSYFNAGYFLSVSALFTDLFLSF